MKFVRIFFLISIFSVSSCQRDGVEEFAVFYWDQTKCADPWGTGEGHTDEKTIEAVISFLEDKSIAVESVEMRQGSNLDTFCEACHCGTGKQIIILVEEESYPKMEKIMNLQTHQS